MYHTVVSELFMYYLDVTLRYPCTTQLYLSYSCNIQLYLQGIHIPQSCIFEVSIYHTVVPLSHSCTI